MKARRHGARLTVPRRYQLKKNALRVFERGHPWLYRGQVSSAIQVFGDGQWLRLVDGNNEVYGYGMYEAEGAIAIRLLKRGHRPPDGAWVAERVERALSRRRELAARTNAYRAVHGENDGLAAVVLDVFGPVGVLQTYSRGADALGRLVAAHVRRALGLEGVVWKPARRRRVQVPAAPRCLYGALAAPVAVPVYEDREAGLGFLVDVLGGQKSGAFLDLRGLRRWVASRELGGARVLNLFSYTGTLGLAAEKAGAREVWNVDASESALAFGRSQAVSEECTRRWIAADVFDWLPALDRSERFDLIIVDPPLMTSRVAGVPRALAAYKRLYRHAAAHLAPGGHLIACCCTSRISYSKLRSTLERALAPGGGRPALTLLERLPPEPDHPARFAQADYLKILIYGPANA